MHAATLCSSSRLPTTFEARECWSRACTTRGSDSVVESNNLQCRQHCRELPNGRGRSTLSPGWLPTSRKLVQLAEFPELVGGKICPVSCGTLYIRFEDHPSSTRTRTQISDRIGWSPANTTAHLEDLDRNHARRLWSRKIPKRSARMWKSWRLETSL